MTDAELDRLTADAKAHAEHAQADIRNATTRLEHVRLTGLAQEARNLYTVLSIMQTRKENRRATERATD